MSSRSRIQCSACNDSLPVHSFHKDESKKTGRQGKCKSCCSRYSKSWYLQNYTTQRKIHSEWRNKNKPQIDIYQKVNQPSRTIQQRKRRQQNPIVHRAHRKVKYAIATGKLIVGLCAHCGISPKKVKMHAHHEDYNKPLEIIWLCPSCHRISHSENRAFK